MACVIWKSKSLSAVSCVLIKSFYSHRAIKYLYLLFTVIWHLDLQFKIIISKKKFNNVFVYISAINITNSSANFSILCHRIFFNSYISYWSLNDKIVDLGRVFIIRGVKKKKIPFESTVARGVRIQMYF